MPSKEDIQKPTHEQAMNKIELEMQGEGLKKIALDLRMAEANHLNFYELTSVGYLTLDEKGCIWESNLAGARLLGFDSNLLIDKPLELLIHPQSKGTLRSFMTNLFSGTLKESCELRLKGTNGADTFVHIEGMAHIDTTHDGTSRGRVVMFDITKRKNAEKDLETFSYSISHDLREPLRAINGFSRMLARDLEAKHYDEAQRKLNIIQEKGKIMDQLITDVLDYSRLGREKLNIAPINMDKLLQKIWQELRDNLPDRDVTLKVSQLPDCSGDEKSIRQALINLLSNALKFTGKKQSATIEVGGQENCDECTYYVKDNGIGFDMNYSDKLFNLFRRLHSNEEFEGTGAGLAIVKRTIVLHGGCVWAEGHINEGATFYFTLPRRYETS